MSAAYFIAKRIFFSKVNDTQRVSPPAIRIAIAGIAIGLAIMLLTVAIVVGFKHEIRNKVSDFGGHLQVLALSSNGSFEKQPICIGDSMLAELEALPNVQTVKPFITKPAAIKTDKDFLSVVFKSADVDEREIFISETISRKLKIKQGDRVQVFFVQNNGLERNLNYGAADVSVKVRTLTVGGTYQTHFNQYDEQVIWGNFNLLQQIGSWDEDMASGLEVRLSDINALHTCYADLSNRINLTQDRRGTQLTVKTLEQQNPQIFGWLELLDINVVVILALMVVVSTFTMVSGLLIIILERTKMIAQLKAMGCSDSQLKRTFLYVALLLTLQGLIWGNVAGVGLCAIQKIWHPFALDPENYYLEWVPISITWWHVAVLNIGTLAITMLMLLVPATIVSKISPARILSTD